MSLHSRCLSRLLQELQISTFQGCHLAIVVGWQSSLMRVLPLDSGGLEKLSLPREADL